MKYLGILFSLLFSTTVIGQTPLPDEVLEHIHQRIELGVNPAIAIGIVDADGMHYYNFGQTHADGKPVDEHSIFEIGSITKTFTGIILADMSLKGQVGIDDPVNAYLPAKTRVPARNNVQITLGHLSDHTSALPRMPDNFTPADGANPYADYSVQQLYDFIMAYTLQRDIGSEYEYSNLAQGLLGHVLALKAGKSYEELMVETIAAPLKMDETRITFTEEMKENLALPHADGAIVANWDLPTLAGAGAIRSSTHDMLKYLAANMSQSRTPLHKAMRLSHKSRHQKGGARVGLGWHIVEGSEGDVITHGGATGGYSAFVGFVKETGRGVVVLTNCTSGVEEIGFRLLSSKARLSRVRAHVVQQLREHIDQHGQAGLSAKVEELKAAGDKYDFSENKINDLGYYYLANDNVDAALAVFRLNTEEHPESFNVWDSYAEALMEKGFKDEAIFYYKKSLEINPANINGTNMLAKLGVQHEMKDHQVSEAVLETYVGKYELAPGFIIEITREGAMLKGQATGQEAFEMFATTDTDFYLKVVAAQIKFNFNTDGSVKSLTLFQGGQVIEGKRM